MTAFKFRSEPVDVMEFPRTDGPHRRVAVFAGPDADHLARCGFLIMRTEEVDDFLALIEVVEVPVAEIEEVADRVIDKLKWRARAL